MADIRIYCVVPGCRHTRGDRKGDPVTPTMEWICGDHRRHIPRAMRALYRRAYRRADRAEARFNSLYDANLSGQDATGFEDALEAATRALNVRARLWRRVRREAIERSLGL